MALLLNDDQPKDTLFGKNIQWGLVHETIQLHGTSTDDLWH